MACVGGRGGEGLYMHAQLRVPALLLCQCQSVLCVCVGGGGGCMCVLVRVCVGVHVVCTWCAWVYGDVLDILHISWIILPQKLGFGHLELPQ
jgi:hypothetical protein